MDNLIIDGNKLAEIAMDLAADVANYHACIEASTTMCKVTVNDKEVVLSLTAQSLEHYLEERLANSVETTTDMREAVAVTKFPLEQD